MGTAAVERGRGGCPARGIHRVGGLGEPSVCADSGQKRTASLPQAASSPGHGVPGLFSHSVINTVCDTSAGAQGMLSQ